MSASLIASRQDLDWLSSVHNVPTMDATNAILYGNEDCPQIVEVFHRNHYRNDSSLYVADENGNLQLKRLGTLRTLTETEYQERQTELRNLMK